jgi:methyltransferase family protein
VSRLARLVDEDAYDIDPETDPGLWGHSLANLAELLFGCLEAAQVRSIVELGAYAGDLTKRLADWADTAGARVTAVDPFPQDRLVRLAAERANVELVRQTSIDALPELPPTDAVVVDGDHNYFTVSEELRLIAAAGGDFPLVLLHDVCWPHGRRDDYYAPDQIPAEYRQPIAEGGGLFPGEPGIVPGALPYRAAAAREGGPRNGVRTAVEDFVAGRDDLELAIVPAFFGLGVVWRRDAPWADAVGAVLAPWDRNPLLARLERNRVVQLAQAQRNLAEVVVERDRTARRDEYLRRLLESSAFGVAERLSRLRVRLGIATEHSQISKDEIRRALRD